MNGWMSGNCKWCMGCIYIAIKTIKMVIKEHQHVTWNPFPMFSTNRPHLIPSPLHGILPSRPGLGFSSSWWTTAPTTGASPWRASASSSWRWSCWCAPCTPSRDATSSPGRRRRPWHSATRPPPPPRRPTPTWTLSSPCPCSCASTWLVEWPCCTASPAFVCLFVSYTTQTSANDNEKLLVGREMLGLQTSRNK